MPPKKKLDIQAAVYIGTADVRQISKADWANVDVNDQGAVSWHAGNNFSVPLEELSDSAIAYLETDAGFVIKAQDVPVK